MSRLSATFIGLILTFALAGCTGAGVTPLPHVWVPSVRERVTNVPAGVDFGLHRQCIRTGSPFESNFYSDDTDCPGSSYPTSHYWTTAVETETRSGPGSCGIVDQSLPIDADNSPVTQRWYGSPSSGYRVEIETDFSHAVNPCHSASWTWVPLMDNANGGGPLPRPDQFVMQFHTQFDTVDRGAGATRAFAGLGAQWLAAGQKGAPTLVTVEIEVDYYTDAAWTKQSKSSVICYRAPSRVGAGLYYVALDGRFLQPTISLAAFTPGTISVQWSGVLEQLIAAKMLPPPLGGWAASSAQSTAGYVGSEVRDDVKGVGGPTADMQIWSLEEFAAV